MYLEEGGWTPICRELDVASCGDTFDKAAENVMDAVEVYLEGNAQEGELDRVLREAGLEVLEYPAAFRVPAEKIKVKLDEWVSRKKVPIPVET